MAQPLIADPKALADLCQALRGQPWVALDTEFMRTRTYRARLCLVQVATPSIIACVDVVALSDIEPLLERIYDPNLLKVIHAARQDLEVFADIRGAPPAPVFDTQIAAALCGYDDQIGYANLVETLTGHKLPKLHTRADWETRPLPSDQLEYAEDDVRYLRDVYRVLTKRLEQLGRSGWIAEEGATLTDPELYRNDPREAYRRLKQGPSLSPAAQTVLQELAAWRERTAQEKNLPRSWVVPDAALVEIAVAAPSTLATLTHIPSLSDAAVRRFGRELLAAVVRGCEHPPQRWWEEAPRLDRSQQALYERLQARVQTAAAEAKISATLLAPRRELLRLLSGQTTGPLARGWRRALVGEELLRLCDRSADAAAQ